MNSSRDLQLSLAADRILLNAAGAGPDSQLIENVTLNALGIEIGDKITAQSARMRSELESIGIIIDNENLKWQLEHDKNELFNNTEPLTRDRFRIVVKQLLAD